MSSLARIALVVADALLRQEPDEEEDEEDGNEDNDDEDGDKDDDGYSERCMLKFVPSGLAWG
jgi:hypothetical protein